MNRNGELIYQYEGKANRRWEKLVLLDLVRNGFSNSYIIFVTIYCSSTCKDELSGILMISNKISNTILLSDICSDLLTRWVKDNQLKWFSSEGPNIFRTLWFSQNTRQTLYLRSIFHALSRLSCLEYFGISDLEL